MNAYGSRPVKRRRRTKVELDALDDAIVTAVELEKPVTLRGVYYRVVSAGAIDKTETAYRTVGRELVKLRRDGRVPYSAITDGTRWITKPDTHDDLETMLADARASYRRALWRDQRVNVHVFTEKDAISGVILPITAEWDVPLGVLRGYCSETFAHNVAEDIVRAGKPTYVYQLGDHDPSGLDAWRSFQEKVTGFLPDGRFPRNDVGDRWPMATFERLAVTEDQITEYDLPTRPTKTSDSRAKTFTGGSVEVDALPAPVLRELIGQAIEQHIDTDALDLTQAVEEQERDLLTTMIDRTWAS